MSLRTLFVLTLLARIAVADQLFHYGALAIDRRDGFYYGWANDYPTLGDAIDRALAECTNRGGKCRVVLAWSGRGCGAYRTIDGKVGTAYGWGVAATRDEADAIARREAEKRSKHVPATNFVWGCNERVATPFRPLFDAGGVVAEPRTFVHEGGWADVNGLAVSPDSKTVAAADGSGKIRLWEVASGQQRQVLEAGLRDAFDVAYSPDGRWLASAHLNGAVLWNARTGRSVQNLRGHMAAVKAVAFSPDSATLATGASSSFQGMDTLDDGGVRLWSVPNGSSKAVYPHLFKYGVHAVAFGNDGTVIAGGDAGEAARRLRVLSGGQWLSAGNVGWARSIAVSNDGRLLASASFHDQMLEVFELPSFRPLFSKKTRTPLAVAFSPDGGELASGHIGGQISVWDVASGTLVETLNGHERSMNALAYAPDGSFLASGSDDRTVRIWPRDAAAGDAALRAVLETEQGHVKEVAKRRATKAASEARRRRDAKR